MSKTFHNLFFTQILKELVSTYPVQIVGISSTCHLFYALGTKEKKEIIVTKKYQFDKNGFTNFMVVDENGNHYNVNNSTWFMKWDSIEDWSSVEVNDKLQIKYYGWRIPFFGTFPNIVSTRKNLNVSYKVVLEQGADGLEPKVVYSEEK